MPYKKVDISVIIPVYNPGEYLKECLESVVNQDFTGSYEIILIDDGSTDKSPETLREYAQKHKNISVITQKNSGQSKARNEGLKIAIGEYISFIDSDDLPAKNNLSALYSTAKGCDAEIVIGGFRYISTKTNEPEYPINGDLCGVRLSPEQFFKRAAKMPLILSCVVVAKLIRREIFFKNNLTFPEGRRYEDIIMFPQICSKAASFAFISDIIYNYRIGVLTSTTADPERSYKPKDINDIFTSALDVSNLSIETAPKEAGDMFKRAITESVIVFYMEYQVNELARISTDKLDESYIFFGASTWAERCVDALGGRAQNVVLSDNDENKHDKEMFGHRVIPPNNLKNSENLDKKIMITSMYFMDIYTQMKEMGIISNVAQLMPRNGETDTEKLYISWIKKIATATGKL